MKPKLSLPQFFVTFLVLALSPAPRALSQIPQGFNYQAIARDAGTGNPITDPVDVKIAILSDDDPVTIIREELFTAVDPDEHGLFNVVVGQGAWSSGPVNNFSDIDWTVTPKYILTKIYYGGDWQNLGPAQLWSVPYAMYSPSTNPWLLNGSSTYYNAGRVGIWTSTPAAALSIHENANTGITYPLYIVNASGDWTDAEKGVGLKFGRINPTSGHDYGSIRATIASYNGGEGRLQLTGGGGTDPHVTVNWNGSVGIGTITPAARLHVFGNDNISTVVQSNNTIGTSLEISNSTVSNKFQLSLGGSANTVPGAFAVYDSYAGQARIFVKPDGNVGIGTINPIARLAVQPAAGWADETPLFEVKNKHGIPVLAVYNNGVKINIEHDPDGVKGVKGGFAIGGYDYTKSGTGTVTFMNITPDSIRFNINNDNVKGPKGGFAIGGFDYTKGDINEDFLYITPQNSASGLYNTFAGYQAGFENSSGYSNVFIGYKSGYKNYVGYNNVYVGTNAGEKNLGSNNVLIGDDAGKSLTNGNKNLYIGSLAGSTDVNGDYNTYIGIEAGRYETGSDNVLIGYGAGYGAGESNLFAIGNRNNPGLISGYFDTKKIYLWGDVKIETSNAAPRLHLKGEGNVMNMEGTTYCYTYYYPDGFAAGPKAFLGYGNGTSNDFVIENLVSSGNLQINPGSSANVQIYNLLSGTGTSLVVDGTGKIFKSTSDARLKENIIDLQGTLDKIMKMRGVGFSMVGDDTHSAEIGLIAQEVEKIYPELVMTSHDGYMSVKYQNITAILIEGMKEQQKQIESQQQQIDELKAMVEKLMVR